MLPSSPRNSGARDSSCQNAASADSPSTRSSQALATVRRSTDTCCWRATGRATSLTASAARRRRREPRRNTWRMARRGKRRRRDTGSRVAVITPKCAPAELRGHAGPPTARRPGISPPSGERPAQARSGAGVAVPVWRCRCGGAGVAAPVWRRRCGGAGVAVSVWRVPVWRVPVRRVPVRRGGTAAPVRRPRCGGRAGAARPVWRAPAGGCWYGAAPCRAACRAESLFAGRVAGPSSGIPRRGCSLSAS